MTTYKIEPVGPLHRKDGGGLFYEIAMTLKSPYDRPKYYTITVMARGLEKGFATLAESIGSSTGRERVSERTIIPQWMRDMEKTPLLEKIAFKEGRAFK